MEAGQKAKVPTACKMVMRIPVILYKVPGLAFGGWIQVPITLRPRSPQPRWSCRNLPTGAFTFPQACGPD